MAILASANERAAATLDRLVVNNWQPVRGAQMAHALVEGLLHSGNTGAVQARIVENVRTMK